MSSAMILGQMSAAVLSDAAGIMGLTARDISLKRITAIGFVAAGVLLSSR